MKIVHLIDTMALGGAEKLVSLLCRWQRQQGHDASVHCLYGAAGIFGEELRRDGFEVVLHDRKRIGGRAASVYRRLKQSRPDVLHCHNAPAAILGALPARVAGVRKIVVTRHGIVAPPYLLRRELKFAVASRWCDWVVAVCERAKHNLMAAPFATRKEIICIYNAALAPHRNGAHPPAKCGFTLLHVGRLSPVKDQETLLRAFAMAKAHAPDLQLWIVGGGSLHSRLQSLAQQIGIEGSVTFFGEQTDVARFFLAADLFILSSITEGIPVSLLEALGAGVPAVVTDVGGMSEVARLSDAIITVPHSDPAALAGAIEKMVKSREQLPRLKTTALECFAAHFTIERMARQYMALYNGAHPNLLN
jgi:glycosyltransferase involved in cell wall biosynthesis